MTTTTVPASERAERALAATVNELEIRYTGGTAFFDALDERMRDPYWFRALLDRAHDLYGYHFDIAVSGEFGRKFVRWLADAYDSTIHRPPITFPGDLRHTTLREGFVNEVRSNSHPFVFLDDSYYKGRTFGQVKSALEAAGGIVAGAVVLYDGSLDVPRVTSLFRYHSPRSTRVPL